MLTELQLQRIYDRIELVAGVGDPNRGQLCIMSLVAFLAGEGHGDMPRTASPMIREFAIPLNDRLDSRTRQQLKPLAPRIIGTADGEDEKRADMLYRAVLDEVVPDLLRRLEGRPALGQAGLGRLIEIWPGIKDAPASQLVAAIDRSQARRRYLEAVHVWLRGLRGSHTSPAAGPSSPAVIGLRTLFGRRAERHDQCLLHAVLDVIKARASGKYGRMAAAAAHLLLACVMGASDPKAKDWYRIKAVDLLDRMCDIGAKQRAAGVRSERVAQLESILSLGAGPRDRTDGREAAVTLV